MNVFNERIFGYSIDISISLIALAITRTQEGLNNWSDKTKET